MKLVWRDDIYELLLHNDELRICKNGDDQEPIPITFDGDRVQTPDGRFQFAAIRDRKGIWVTAAGTTGYLEFARPDAGSATHDEEIRSPMTGTVVSIHVKAGDSVQAGDLLSVVTAMKMEFRIESPRDGEVEGVNHEVGDLVDLGDILIQLVQE